MIGRRVPLAALASGLVALAACTSAPSSGSAAGTPPASSRSPATPATSRSPASAVSDRTAVIRVGLFTENFDAPLPGDRPEADVIIGFRTALILWDKSQQNFGLVAPVTSYVTGSALSSLKSTLTYFAQKEQVPAGSERVFATLVTGVSATGVTGPRVEVESCVDGSKSLMENPRTHAIDNSYRNLPPSQQYIYLIWGMTQVGGHWAMKSVRAASPSSAAAKSCLP